MQRYVTLKKGLYCYSPDIVYLQMMDDLQRCFNEVQKEQEENHFSICNILDNIDETCRTINNQASDTCKIKTEKQNDLQERFQSDLEIVKKVVVEGADKVKNTKVLRKADSVLYNIMR